MIVRVTPAASAVGLSEEQLEVDLALEASHAALETRERRDDGRQVAILGGLPAQQLAFDAGAWRAGGGQDVDRLEEVGLALAVAAANKTTPAVARGAGVGSYGS